jgi:hypothetical protein
MFSKVAKETVFVKNQKVKNINKCLSHKVITTKKKVETL